MTSADDDPTLPGRPPVVDQATREAARDGLLVREKAHTREGDDQPADSAMERPGATPVETLGGNGEHR